MPTIEECGQHIQNTVDLLYRFEKFENKAFVIALSFGIQGKKREGRIAGTVDENIRKYLQSEAFDLFGKKIFPNEPTEESGSFPDVDNIESFLTEYRRGLWEMYWKLSNAANVFVAPLCLRDLSCPLYKRASCIKKAIVDLNRKIKRWHDMKEQGTALHDLFIYETTEYNNHDEAEKAEAKMGYDY